MKRPNKNTIIIAVTPTIVAVNSPVTIDIFEKVDYVIACKKETMSAKKLWYLLVIALLTIMLTIPNDLVLADSSQEMVDVLVTF